MNTARAVPIGAAAWGRGGTFALRAPVIDASGFLALFLLLLFVVPAQLVIRPLGAAGRPAMLFGLVGFVWWASSRIAPGIGAATGWQPVRWSINLFAGVAVLSYAIAMTTPLWPDEVSGADRSVLTLLSLIGVAYIAADGIASEDELERLLRGIVVAGAFLSLIGILQFMGFDLAQYLRFPGLSPNGDLTFVGERSIFRRPAGTSSHPIEFGVVLAMVAPLAFHFGFAPGRRVRTRWLVPLGLILLGMPMSVSRSAILGFVVAALVMFVGWTPRQRWIALIVGPPFLVGMRALVPGLLGTIRSLFTNLSSDPSIQGRTNDYRIVVDLFEKAPVFGRGLGTFNPIRYTTLDNQYLGVLLECGLVGLSAFLLIFIVGIGCARGARRIAADDTTRDLGQALAASLMVVVVTFATFDGLAFPMVSGTTFVMVGAAGALWRLVRSRPPHGSLHPNTGA